MADEVVPTAFIRLVDTNLFPLPGKETEDPGPGEGEGEPGEDGPGETPDIPWPTLGLFAAAAVAASVLAYRRFRLTRSREDAGEETRPFSGDRRD